MAQSSKGPRESMERNTVKITCPIDSLTHVADKQGVRMFDVGPQIGPEIFGICPRYWPTFSKTETHREVVSQVRALQDSGHSIKILLVDIPQKQLSMRGSTMWRLALPVWQISWRNPRNRIRAEQFTSRRMDVHTIIPSTIRGWKKRSIPKLFNSELSHPQEFYSYQSRSRVWV